MIRQDELKVKVGETKSAVTGFGGVSALVGVAYQTGMVDALDSRLQQVKRRCRGCMRRRRRWWMSDVAAVRGR